MVTYTESASRLVLALKNNLSCHYHLGFSSSKRLVYVTMASNLFCFEHFHHQRQKDEQPNNVEYKQEKVTLIASFVS